MCLSEQDVQNGKWCICVAKRERYDEHVGSGQSLGHSLYV